MAGTRTGGLQAATTNKERHGDDFYQRIGATGGSKSRTGGFYGNPELASRAGRMGGSISRRGPIKRDYCPNDHQMTPENTYVYPGRGVKSCRQCQQESNRRSRAKRKAQA